MVVSTKWGSGGAGAASFSRLESKVPDILLCSGESHTIKNCSTSHMALKCPPNTPVGKTPICDDLGLESIVFYTQPQKQTCPALTHSESSRSMIPHKLRKGPAWLRAPWRAAECLGTTSLMPVQAPPHKVGSSGSSTVLSSAGTSPQALARRMYCLITCSFTIISP